MYQMKKYTSPGLIPHRPQTMSYQDRSSMYGSHVMPGELSPTDPKPRLRWTAELHERFVDAVNQLGGADSKFWLLHSNFCCEFSGKVFSLATVASLLWWFQNFCKLWSSRRLANMSPKYYFLLTRLGGNSLKYRRYRDDPSSLSVYIQSKWMNSANRVCIVTKYIALVA